jgi:hypothetical protein
MSNSSIVSSLSPEELLNLFRKEAKIEANGSVSFTRRGVARLVEKDKVQIQRLLIKCSGDKTAKKPLSKPLRPFFGKVFGSGDSLDDVVVSAVISHYSTSTAGFPRHSGTPLDGG